ncbi:MULTISPECIES: nitroreductase family protein [Amycolatopsis]|uniref:nitroreductase family protein n=1 Tax=Amycolatopsis TaxID=1813 RepID=UPI00106FA3F3|nr:MULTISPECIES: nitroreductase family protein [Amycolatopsis]MCG3753040.1 nitroreductase family protein [Amycolatopsis sp. Poz14]
MEFQEVVRRRRMVRKFTDEPVAEESIRRIMRNALRGPSAGFSQGQAFLVLQGDDVRRFADTLESWTLGDDTKAAPVIVIPFSVKDVYLDRYAQPDKGWTDRSEDHWPVPFWYIDTGMAVLLILQTVVDEGLGAVYFGIGAEDFGNLRAEFGIPDTHEPIGAIAIGHDADAKISAGASPATRRRKPETETVHYGQW